MIGRLRDILGRIRKDVLRQVNSSATTPPKHESIELKDFDRFVDRYYNFLLTERNFAVSERGWRGNEYYVLFSKGTILIDIGLETGSIPFVSIQDKASARHSYDYHYVDSLEWNETLRDIYSRRLSRLESRHRDNSKATLQLASDAQPGRKTETYLPQGRRDNELILREIAQILRRYPQILQGDLSPFTKSDLLNINIA